MPRLLAPVVGRALRTMPVVIVTGARQTGKSTLVRHLIGPRDHVTLDDIDVLARAQLEPAALVAGRRAVTLDEVQRAPALLHAVKQAVDGHRVAGRFVLTGSADLLLMRQVSDPSFGSPGTRGHLDLDRRLIVRAAGSKYLGTRRNGLRQAPAGVHA